MCLSIHKKTPNDNIPYWDYDIENKNQVPRDASAAAIVALANQFSCTITVSSAKGESDAQDMLRLMLLEASIGTEVCISAIGEDAKKAVEALVNFVKAGFGELED